MTDTVTAAAEGPRPLRVIAEEIFADWKTMAANENNPAHPYVTAMRELDTIDDRYFADSGVSVVQYFLGNAQGWRGDTARRIKDELRAIVKDR